MSSMSMRRTVAAVPCPKCGYAYSRAREGSAVDGGYRRRRICVKCEHGFITYEIPARESASDY